MKKSINKRVLWIKRKENKNKKLLKKIKLKKIELEIQYYKMREQRN